MRPIKYGQILMAFFMGLLFLLQGVPVSAETAYLKSKMERGIYAKSR